MIVTLTLPRSGRHPTFSKLFLTGQTVGNCYGWCRNTNFKMRLYLLISFILLCISAHSQPHTPDFYLIDSLQLEELSQHDVELLDSMLLTYHEVEHDTAKIAVLLSLVDGLWDRPTWVQYNEIVFRKVEPQLELNLSPYLERFYLRSLALTIHSRGFNEHEQGRSAFALEYYFKALEIQEEQGFNHDALNTLLNIGSVYHGLDKKDVALRFFVRAYDLSEAEPEHPSLPYLYNNLAVLYDEQKNYEKSLQFQQLVLDFTQKSGQQGAMAMSLNNMGGVLLKLDSFERGIAYLDSALAIFLSMLDHQWIAYTYHKRGRGFFEQGEVERGLEDALLALEYAELANDLEPLRRASNLLHSIYQAKGEDELALAYYKQHILYRDSINDRKVQQEADRRELEYEYNRQKLADQQENEKQIAIAEVEKEQQKTISWIMIGGMSLVLIFALMLIHRLRMTRQQKRVIEKQNEERKILLKEVHHRVKNNFQVISSILRLQAYDENNEHLQAAFEDAINRIRSMAAVHELIYKEESFATISPEQYFKTMIASLEHTSARTIDYHVKSDVSQLNAQTLIALGITLNELITNSVKYGFTDAINDPRIDIQLKQSGENAILTYQENGIGFRHKKSEGTFGMELIDTVLEQIEGSMNLSSAPDWNTVVAVEFPV